MTERIDEISTITGGRPAVVPQKYWDDTAAEHGYLMPPYGMATHTSIKDGNWNDPAIWDAGTIPGDGAIVMVYHAVTYDSTSTAKLDTVSVHGTLKLTSTKSVMWVDTLFGHGFLDGGTSKSPAQAEFIFCRQQAPETTTRLGMTWMGKARLHGEPKTVRLYSLADIPVGATSCDLEGLGTASWQIGDQILFIATENLPNASTDPQYRGPPQVWSTYQGQAGTASDYKVLKNDNGFRQSADEVRTITEISGTELTFDEPLTHAHRVYGGTLPHGQVITLNPPVCNLTRSIVFRSAEASEGGDLTDLQQRAQIMLCHNDDVQVRYVEFRNTGRSTTDPSLVRADGKLAYASDPAASPAPAPITDPKNIPGLFAFHIHSTGPYFGRRQVVVEGCTVWAPDEPIPGWALVHHHSRCAIEDCVVYNARGAGIVSELGTEIGQWIGNTVAWCRGDGYKNNWGTRAEYWPHHDGHMGAAYENQARQILQRGNIASSSTTAWLYQPQHDGDITRRSPDGQSLRYKDPVVQGGEEQNSYANSWPALKDTYFPDQPQIPNFDDNTAYACGSGFSVIHRHKNDRYDPTPLIMRRFHFINVGSAVNVLNYTYGYSCYDSLWVGSDGKGNAVNLGPVSHEFNFVNILFCNWDLAIKDSGVGVNYNGFVIDCGLENVRELSNHFNPTMSSDPALSSKKDIMGPWTDIKQTGTKTWTVRARTYLNLNSRTDLPQPYPLPIVWAGSAWGVSGSVPVPPASTPIVLPGDPPIWIPNTAQNDLTKPATARGGISISGVIRDCVGDRKYPDWQSSESFTAQISYKGPRRAHYMTGIQMVERNGCFQDGTQWKSPLWFCDHDRFTGEHFVFRVDVLLGSDYDPAFLQANVVDPVATQPVLPLPPERLRQDEPEPEPEPEPGFETVHLDITTSERVSISIAINAEVVVDSLATRPVLPLKPERLRT